MEGEDKKKTYIEKNSSPGKDTIHFAQPLKVLTDKGSLIAEYKKIEFSNEILAEHMLNTRNRDGDMAIMLSIFSSLSKVPSIHIKKMKARDWLFLVGKIGEMMTDEGLELPTEKVGAETDINLPVKE